MTDDADDWVEYDSGPFCRHWDDLYACDIKCAECGHGCIEHRGDRCEHEYARGECTCMMWVEPS